MARKKKHTKTSIRKAISEAGSSVKAIADHLNVTPRTVYNYLKEFELWDELLVTQELLKMMAAGNVIHAVEHGDLDTSKWVLERLGKNEGWTKRSELTGPDGEALLRLPPDVAQQAREQGLDLDEVTRIFGTMLLARAQQADLEQRRQLSLSDPDNAE